MKELQQIKQTNPLLLGIGAFIFGLILILTGKDSMYTIVQIFGIMAIIVAISYLLSHIKQTKNSTNRWGKLPIGIILGIVIGTTSLVNPKFWSDLIMIVIGVIVILMGISQLITFIKIKKANYKVSASYFIFPILVTIAGVVIVLDPKFLADFIVIFAGVCIMLYALIEIITYLTIKQDAPKQKESKQEIKLN